MSKAGDKILLYTMMVEAKYIQHDSFEIFTTMKPHMIFDKPNLIQLI